MKMTTKKTTETPQTELRTHGGDTQKASHGAKIALKNASMKEQRKRWKLVGGMLVEMGSDDDDR